MNVIADARILGTVSWQKVDASSKDPLDGSEWTLTYTPDSTGAASVAYTVSDADGTAACTASAEVLCDEDNTKGSFKLTGLQGGAYTLVESKAPDGYVIDKTPYHFTISAENQSVVLGNMKNEKAVTALPLTGSVWTPRNVALLGFGLLGVSIVSFVAAQRRRRSDVTLRGTGRNAGNPTQLSIARRLLYGGGYHMVIVATRCLRLYGNCERSGAAPRPSAASECSIRAASGCH